MALSLNRVTLIGNVGQDPRVNNNGQVEVFNFSLATSRSWLDRNTNQWQNQTDWHNIVIFINQNQAHTTNAALARQIRKGSYMFVEGQLRSRKYQDNMGNERYITEVYADDFVLLERPQNPNSAFAQGQGQIAGQYNGGGTGQNTGFANQNFNNGGNYNNGYNNYGNNRFPNQQGNFANNGVNGFPGQQAQGGFPGQPNQVFSGRANQGGFVGQANNTFNQNGNNVYPSQNNFANKGNPNGANTNNFGNAGFQGQGAITSQSLSNPNSAAFLSPTANQPVQNNLAGNTAEKAETPKFEEATSQVAKSTNDNFANTKVTTAKAEKSEKVKDKDAEDEIPF